MKRPGSGFVSRKAGWWTGLALSVLTSAIAGAGEHPADQRDHCDSPAVPANAEGLGALSIPDVLLQDQEGEEIRFYSDLVQGRIVAINFVFTTCTTICPPMGANFARLQRILKEQAGSDAHLISVSVDPAVDTPRRLKSWAAKFGAQPGWTLVTGAKPEVDKLLKALKVFTPDKTDHSPIVLIGDDARGDWTRVWGLAPPTELARVIERMTGAPDAATNDRAGDRK